MFVNPKLIYSTLRWICISYLLPIGYAGVVLGYRKWFQGYIRMWKLAFMQTAKIAGALCVVAVLWAAVVCILIMIRYRDHKNWRRKLRDNIPEYDPEVLDAFETVCSRLNIPKDKMSLQKNVLVSMPLIIGIRHPQVLLPERDYSREDLEMIFYHELSHYKQKDLLFKALAVTAMLVHCFNPLIYLLLREINLWSECMADVSALEASDSLHHAKPYFDNIMNLIPDDTKSEKEKFFFSTLYRNQNTLTRRVDFMKKYMHAKVKGKAATAALTAAFVFASATTAFASAGTVADLHNMIYQQTELQKDETISDADRIGTSVVTADGMTEYYCRVEDLGDEDIQVVSTPDKDMVTFAENVMYRFEWTVNPNTRHVSGDYKIKSGRVVCTSVVVAPSTKDFKLGIMTDDGVARFVRGQGSAAHNFDITETNNYRVFVQNDYKDGTKLDAAGYFYYAVK